MLQRIAGLFTRRSDAEKAVHDLLRQGISAENITLIVIAEHSPVAPTDHPQRDEATTVFGSGLARLLGGTRSVRFGVGLLIAGPLAATLGAAECAAEEKEADKTLQLEQFLMRGGLLEEQACASARGIRQGRSLVAVAAEEHQSELIADILRWYKGSWLEVHRRND